MALVANEIKRRVERIRAEIPENVDILGAVKTRSIEEVQAARAAGLCYFGHNYVQEAGAMIPEVEGDVKWHMIGHLQRNKVRQAVQLFDLIESLDSQRLAVELEKRCAEIGKMMPVLIEVNSGREENKTGLLPEDVGLLAEWVSGQTHLRLVGLMTMGPLTGDPELSRPYYKETRRLFEEIDKQRYHDIDMRILSMGMSNSYHVAIEEGANLIRLGTVIFGPRGG
jgi:pyridoxal phosphate enzyme (YggS family)